MDDNTTKPVRKASEKWSRTCYECGKQTRRIYDHLFQDHSYTKDRLEQLKKEDRIRQLADKTNVAYMCDCGNSYPNVNSLRRHQVQKHESEIASYVLCPLCGERLRDHWKLIDHANCEHIESEEIYSIEAMTFDSIEKFKEWKTDMENETVSRFNVVRCYRKQKCEIKHYHCSRALRHPKYGESERPGTKVVQRNCTAFMKVIDTGCKVNVKFCRRHLGHDEEPAKLTLDTRFEEYIVSLLKEGFRPHQIIRKIRDTLSLHYRDIIETTKIHGGFIIARSPI